MNQFLRDRGVQLEDLAEPEVSLFRCAGQLKSRRPLSFYLVCCHTNWHVVLMLLVVNFSCTRCDTANQVWCTINQTDFLMEKLYIVHIKIIIKATIVLKCLHRC